MTPLRWGIWALFGLGFTFACDTDPDPGGGEGGGAPPATSFLSADRDRGADFSRGGDLAGAPSEDGQGGEAEVVEGDIYRLLGPGRLLNLNPYRGLQVIDFADPAQPRIEGQLAVAGEPVEMYAFPGEDRALVLLNGWRGYYGVRTGLLPEAFEGGLVLSVDLSDPAHPVATDRVAVPGAVRTSRVVMGDGRRALYLVAQQYREDAGGAWSPHTIVQSVDLADDGALTERTELDLGGDVADIQATPGVLLVARNDWSMERQGTRLSLVDISDLDGQMVLGGEVHPAGQVQNKTNMNLQDGVLRVVSSGMWGESNTNHVETFAVHDLANPQPIDHKTFGEGQQLFATVFVAHAGFFVTYFRMDPFHAFAFDSMGFITERAEYVVSGWNDWFRPVLGEARLVGIGVNDEGGTRRVAVSLYDISDLGNPAPMLARAEVAGTGSWSDAQWDDKAFSVVEDAVDVLGPKDEHETGLVLLPFSGWDEAAGRHRTGVQIFTFSGTTLTRRGVMDAETPVRRSFLAEPGLASNLSNETLDFCDVVNPEKPSVLGQVELAPNYADAFVLNGHAVRLHDRRRWSGWWGDDNEEPLPSRLESVPLLQDPDRAAAVASVDIAAGAQVHMVGDLLVAVDVKPVLSAPDLDGKTDWTWETHLAAWDYVDPARPTLAGELVTSELPPTWGGWYGIAEDACLGCRGGYGAALEAYAVGQALVFVEHVPEQAVVGHEHTCVTQPTRSESCAAAPGDEPESCQMYTGGVYCRSLDGAPATCEGEIQRCTFGEEGEVDCVTVRPEAIETTETCWDWDRYRYWSHFRLHVVDLSDPAAPSLGAAIDLGRETEAVSVLPLDSVLYTSYQVPETVDDDERPYVRMFFRALDLSTPSTPLMGPAVNVPGELVAVAGDQVFTRDWRWGERLVESALHRLTVFEGLAVLEASRAFPGEAVDTVLLDGEGHLLASHRPSWQGYGDEVGVGVGGGVAPPSSGDGAVTDEPVTSVDAATPELQALTVMDAFGRDLPVLATAPIDTWAALRGARSGRALFTVPGGLLVLSLDDPTRPRPQAFYATPGWPTRLLQVGRDLLFPAGPYGLYRIDLDARNLLTP